MSPNRKHTSLLLFASIIFMIFSISMPGFYAGGPWYGYFILATMPVAWLSGSGLAVYANLFYIWAWIRLACDKKADTSIGLMLALALFTVTLKDFRMIDGGVLSVNAWGWGAFIWAASLLTLAGAACDKRHYQSVFHTLLPYMIVFTAIIGLVLMYRWSQWQSANSDERSRYLPPGAAFGIFTPSGIPYLPPDNLPLPRGAIIELTDGWQMKHTSPELIVNGISIGESPQKFIYQGYLFQNKGNFQTIIPDTKQNADNVYFYGIRPSKQGESGDLIQYIIKRKQNQNIWYAPAIFLKEQTSIYPNFSQSLSTQLNKLNESYPFSPKDPLVFNSYSLCDQQPYPLSLDLNAEQLIQFNGITFVPSPAENFEHVKIFCSSDYALIVKANYHASYQLPLHFNAVLLRLSNGEILNWYPAYANIADNPTLSTLPENYIPTDHIHRISIHNRELTAYSDFGTFTLRRRGLSNDQDDKKWDDDLEFKWIDTTIH